MADGLSRPASVGVGLALAGLTWGVYSQVMPTVTDLRVGPAGDRDAAAAEKAARWASGGLVVAVSLITRDATVFVFGASMVIVLSWVHRHANMHDPDASPTSMPASRRSMDGDMPAGRAVSA